VSHTATRVAVCEKKHSPFSPKAKKGRGVIRDCPVHPKIFKKKIKKFFIYYSMNQIYLVLFYFLGGPITPIQHFKYPYLTTLVGWIIFILSILL